jgi:hypothetical protein
MENNAAAAEKLNKVSGDYKNAKRAYEQSRDLHTNMTTLNGLAECLQKTTR